MREHKVLYFSLSDDHHQLFYQWASRVKGEKCHLVDWNRPAVTTIHELPDVIVRQRNDIDSLYVIVDYLSFYPKAKDVNYVKERVEEAADVLRRTILQFPEVDFLFDRSGVDKCEKDLPGVLEFLLNVGDGEAKNKEGEKTEKKEDGGGVDNCPQKLPCVLEFLLNVGGKEVRKKEREESEKKEVEWNIEEEIALGLHIFNAESKFPFFFAKLDYDSLFDGSNLRGAVRDAHYKKLNVDRHNFRRLQDSRRRNMALVVDDEPRQSRFNSFVLYASGYRVIPIHTARMLLFLNSTDSECLQPDVIIRDFDLQFPDVSKDNKDYIDYGINNNKDSVDEKNNTSIFKYFDVPKMENNSLTWCDKEIKRVDDYKMMIDYVRDYYYDKDNYKWHLSKHGEGTEFWRNNIAPVIPTFVITNGTVGMIIKGKGAYEKMKTVGENQEQLAVYGMKKPVSGIYHAFFTRLHDDKGNCLIENRFEDTRYIEGEEDYYMDKTRKEHDHGVPADIYDIVREMLSRASFYYKNHHFVKAAVLSQETIELLNGLHYQMMIKAYEMKCKAENAIAMDVVGADESQLVLDAILRIKIIRQDVRRLVYPLYRDEASVIKQYERRKKEHQILNHIFSECRTTCRNNEYFDVESVFIREMAHIDHHDIGLDEGIRYIGHLLELTKRKKKEGVK